jgi:prepilin-type N-terminal cleavage/methylation domain-containing protein
VHRMLTPPRSRPPRRGFTLIEILISLVILSAVAAGLTRLIISQSRFYDAANNLRAARTISRNSMNILLSDLRMVQDENGIDSASADGKAIRVVVPYRFGLVCAVTGGLTTVSLLPTDSSTLALSTFKGFAWRASTGAYTLVTGTAPPVLSASPGLCTGSGAGEAQIRTVSVGGRTGGIFDLAPDAAGAAAGDAIFLWQRIVYKFDESTSYPGKIALWRIVEDGRTDELMAPFDTSARFRFYTAGSDASVTAPPALTQIRGLDLVLNSLSPNNSAWTNAPAEVKMTTSVFFKNVRTF